MCSSRELAVAEAKEGEGEEEESRAATHNGERNL
jgi:hypothetical protein